MRNNVKLKHFLQHHDKNGYHHNGNHDNYDDRTNHCRSGTARKSAS